MQREQRLKSFVCLGALAAFGTLLCCALPILLVTLGLGTVVAALTTSLPWLIPLSAAKGWLFAGSGILIGAGAWLVLRPGRACPPDPEAAAVCRAADRWNRRILLLSISLWCAGFFAAYLALPLRLWLEN